MFQRLFQKKMVNQDKFTAGPYVAVWIGNHVTEDQLDDYLFSGRFSDEYRFRLDERRLPESCVESAPKPLRDLVNGFSRCQKFQDEFLSRAAETGITEASSMIVFHFLVYSTHELPVAKQPEMHFIGNFWFEGFEQCLSSPLNRFLPLVPRGRANNSPAFQRRRESDANEKVPKGRSDVPR